MAIRGRETGKRPDDDLKDLAWLRCRWRERQREEVRNSKDPLAYLLAESEGVPWDARRAPLCSS